MKGVKNTNHPTEPLPPIIYIGMTAGGKLQLKRKIDDLFPMNNWVVGVYKLEKIQKVKFTANLEDVEL